MSLLVTGSIGIDSVRTPFGEVAEVLGGSAVYFSFAAGFFAPVRLVGVVGEDFPQSLRDVLAERPIDLAGLEERKGSKTFRWTGSYVGDMNEAETVDVSLNVLAERGPRIPESFRDSRFVFLANTHPRLQRDLVSQLTNPGFILCDTMNLWIETTREDLLETLKVVDGLVLNDAEARLLTGERNLLTAGRRIIDMGPRIVIVKRGEHGAMMVSHQSVFVLPAYPTENVKDPTGAGDSFAGGLMGYLAEHKTTDETGLRAGLVRGTVAASFAIEDFSLDGVRGVTREQVDERVKEYLDMMPAC